MQVIWAVSLASDNTSIKSLYKAAYIHSGLGRTTAENTVQGVTENTDYIKIHRSPEYYPLK